MNNFHCLTNTEYLIVQLIAYEYTTQQMSEMLYVSIHTIETHRANILEKLEAKNVAGLVRIAIESDLLLSRTELYKHPRIAAQVISNQLKAALSA